MAFKKVEGGSRVSLSKHTKGTEWTGVYIKKYEVDSAMSKNGKQNIYQLMDEDGMIHEFYGCASLDTKMNQVPLNAIVKITHGGTYTSKFGKEAVNAEVEYDDAK